MEKGYRAVVCMRPRGCGTIFYVPEDEINPTCQNCKQKFAIDVNFGNLNYLVADPDKAMYLLL